MLGWGPVPCWSPQIILFHNTGDTLLLIWEATVYNQISQQVCLGSKDHFLRDLQPEGSYSLSSPEQAVKKVLHKLQEKKIKRKETKLSTNSKHEKHIPHSRAISKLCT